MGFPVTGHTLPVGFPNKNINQSINQSIKAGGHSMTFSSFMHGHVYERFLSVVVITFALHAKGPGFEPRRNLLVFVPFWFTILSACVEVWSCVFQNEVQQFRAVWTQVSAFRIQCTRVPKKYFNPNL